MQKWPDASGLTRSCGEENLNGCRAAVEDEAGLAAFCQVTIDPSPADWIAGADPNHKSITPLSRRSELRMLVEIGIVTATERSGNS